MQEQEIKDTVKAIDAILAGWAAMARTILEKNISQSSTAFETAEKALALVQLKEYFERQK